MTDLCDESQNKLEAQNFFEEQGPSGDAINPSHYKSHPSGIECIEVSRHCMSDMGQAIQYIWRATDKNGTEDLGKARWFLADLIHNGFPHFPPWKARYRLIEANQLDTDPQRKLLLDMIATGQINEAISTIDRLLVDV